MPYTYYFPLHIENTYVAHDHLLAFDCIIVTLCTWLYVCMVYPNNEVESTSVKMLLIGSVYLSMSDNVCT